MIQHHFTNNGGMKLIFLVKILSDGIHELFKKALREPGLYSTIEGQCHSLAIVIKAPPLFMSEGLSEESHPIGNE